MENKNHEEIKTRYDTPYMEDVSKLSRRSTKKVMTRCQVDISNKCIGEKLRTYYEVQTALESRGVYICIHCSIQLRTGMSYPITQTGIIEPPFLEDVSTLIRSSSKKVRVMCQSKVAEDCTPEMTINYSSVRRSMDRNKGIYMCFHCAVKLKNTGRNSAGCRYKTLNDNLFKTCDTEALAYLIGWMASDGTCRPDGSMRIKIVEGDIECLKVLRDIVCPELPIKKNKRDDGQDQISLDIFSKQMTKDVCKHLKISPGKKCDLVRIPDMSDELKWVYLRAFFEGDGHVADLYSEKQDRIVRMCSIASISLPLKEEIKEFVGYGHIDKHAITFHGENALNFLSSIYKNSNPKFRLCRKYKVYLEYLEYTPGLGSGKRFPLFKAAKTDSKAVYPISDDEDRYSLTALKVHKPLDEDSIIVYDTCIKIQPNESLSIEMTLDPNIQGYTLVNTGPLKYSYKQTVKIVLRKDSDAEPLVLPAVVASFEVVEE